MCASPVVGTRDPAGLAAGRLRVQGPGRGYDSEGHGIVVAVRDVGSGKLWTTKKHSLGNLRAVALRGRGVNTSYSIINSFQEDPISGSKPTE